MRSNANAFLKPFHPFNASTCCPFAIKLVKSLVNWIIKSYNFRFKSVNFSWHQNGPNHNLRFAHAQEPGSFGASGCRRRPLLLAQWQVLVDILASRESVVVLDYGLVHFWHGHVTCEVRQIRWHCSHSGLFITFSFLLIKFLRAHKASVRNWSGWTMKWPFCSTPTAPSTDSTFEEK